MTTSDEVPTNSDKIYPTSDIIKPLGKIFYSDRYFNIVRLVSIVSSTSKKG